MIPQTSEFGFATIGEAARQRALDRIDDLADQIADLKRALTSTQKARDDKRKECATSETGLAKARAERSLAVSRTAAAQRDLALKRRELGQAALGDEPGLGGPSQAELAAQLSLAQAEQQGAALALAQTEHEAADCAAAVAKVDGEVASLAASEASLRKRIAAIGPIVPGPKASGRIQLRADLNKELGRVVAAKDLKVGQKKALLEICAARASLVASEGARLREAQEAARRAAEQLEAAQDPFAGTQIGEEQAAAEAESAQRYQAWEAAVAALEAAEQAAKGCREGAESLEAAQLALDKQLASLRARRADLATRLQAQEQSAAAGPSRAGAPAPPERAAAQAKLAELRQALAGLDAQLRSLTTSRQAKAAELARQPALCGAKEAAAAVLKTKEAEARLAAEAAYQEKLAAQGAAAAYLEKKLRTGPSLEEASEHLGLRQEAADEAAARLVAAKSAAGACATRGSSLTSQLATLDRDIANLQRRIADIGPAYPGSKGDAKRRLKSDLTRQLEDTRAQRAVVLEDRAANQAECRAQATAVEIAEIEADATRKALEAAVEDREGAEWRKQAADVEAERAAREAAATRIAPMGARYSALLLRIVASEAKLVPRPPRDAPTLRAMKKECAAIQAELLVLERDATSQRGRWMGLPGQGEEPPSAAAIRLLQGRLGEVRIWVDGAVLRLGEQREASEFLDMLEGSFGGGNFTLSDQTRWDRAKQRLAAGVRAYVSGDVMGAMDHFAPSSVIDKTIVRNAMFGDHQEEADIRVDIELLAYAFAGQDLSVSLRWNRIATIKASGGVRPDQGASLLVFTRESDFRVSDWRQSAPFGRRDQTMRAQLQAGQVNDLSGIPQLQPVPVTRTFFMMGHVFIDLEAGMARHDTNLPTPMPLPGEDLRVVRTGFASFDVQAADGSSLAVAACQPIPAGLLDLRFVNQAGLVPAASTTVSRSYFAVRSREGRFGFLEVRVEPDPEQVTFTFVSGDTPSVNLTGTQHCP